MTHKEQERPRKNDRNSDIDGQTVREKETDADRQKQWHRQTDKKKKRQHDRNKDCARCIAVWNVKNASDAGAVKWIDKT